MKIIIGLKEILGVVQSGDSQSFPFPRSMTVGSCLSLVIILMWIK